MPPHFVRADMHRDGAFTHEALLLGETEGTHVVEEGNGFPQVVLTHPPTHTHTCVHLPGPIKRKFDLV